MSGIVGKLMKGGATVRYEWFLRLYPGLKFRQILGKLTKKLGVDVGAGIRDELWCMGLVGERGEARMGGKIRKVIQRELMGMELVVRKRKVKRVDVVERCGKGRERLEETGRLMGYLLVCREYGLVMFQREMGFMVISGRGWCYVYKTGHSFSFTEELVEVGYFRLDGDVELGLRKAMNGEMRYRVQEHGTRRKRYMSRMGRRADRVKIKRSTT
jgi:hypothetical protein